MEALKKNPGELEVLVDNQTAVGNVTRNLRNAGKNPTVTESGEDYIIRVK